MGLTAYLESTQPELSNDVKFVDILVKTTENTLQYSKPPYKFAYARRSHDRVQPPLITYYSLVPSPPPTLGGGLGTRLNFLNLWLPLGTHILKKCSSFYFQNSVHNPNMVVYRGDTTASMMWKSLVISYSGSFLSADRKVACKQYIFNTSQQQQPLNFTCIPVVTSNNPVDVADAVIRWRRFINSSQMDQFISDNTDPSGLSILNNTSPGDIIIETTGMVTNSSIEIRSTDVQYRVGFYLPTVLLMSGEEEHTQPFAIYRKFYVICLHVRVC